MTILESKVRLIVVGGVHDGRVLPVRPPFMIGRAAECHLRPASAAVSLRHCAIEDRQGRPVIRDLGSRNGTFVNGIQLNCDFPLRNADELRIGPLQFLVRIYDLVQTEDGDDEAIKLFDEDDAVIEAKRACQAVEIPSLTEEATPTISRDQAATVS